MILIRLDCANAHADLILCGRTCPKVKSIKFFIVFVFVLFKHIQEQNSESRIPPDWSSKHHKITSIKVALGNPEHIQKTKQKSESWFH